MISLSSSLDSSKPVVVIVPLVIPLSTGRVHSRASPCHGEHPLHHSGARRDLQAAGRNGPGAGGDCHEVGCLFVGLFLFFVVFRVCVCVCPFKEMGVAGLGTAAE